MTGWSRTRDLVLEHRARARLALEDARLASERLRDARERAERLLETSDAVKTPRSHDRLRTRMREIESRMQATDKMMRSAEHDLAAFHDDSGRDAGGRARHGTDGVTESAPRCEPGSDATGAIAPDAFEDVDGIGGADDPVSSGSGRP